MAVASGCSDSQERKLLAAHYADRTSEPSSTRSRPASGANAASSTPSSQLKRNVESGEHRAVVDRALGLEPLGAHAPFDDLIAISYFCEARGNYPSAAQSRGTIIRHAGRP